MQVSRGRCPNPIPRGANSVGGNRCSSDAACEQVREANAQDDEAELKMAPRARSDKTGGWPAGSTRGSRQGIYFVTSLAASDPSRAGDRELGILTLKPS
jgi:hypothetical protein